MLRPSNAGSNTACDHIATTQLALAQLPTHLRRGRQTLIRTDSAGGTHAFLDWLSKPGRWLSYSIAMTITDAIHQAVLKIPKKAWTPAYDADGTERPGASIDAMSIETRLPSAQLHQATVLPCSLHTREWTQ
ncbi:hypothetical protein FHS42_005658 [Streptomyces zagrosensis]|uniref:Transposase DDE domain-containing protein n=1 Tax=Streptomyces zagrosensis TaxID=1042984 RepID=A0A7W9QEI3_9ACTN|nr:hypothetical protein [Streptomyces zagrosensis]